MNIMKPRQQANKLVTILYYSNNVYKKGLLPFTNHFENGLPCVAIGRSITMETHQGDYRKNTPTVFKTILLACGLCGFVLTCSEVESYNIFQEQYSKACDLDLSFVDNLLVQYIYKSMMIFVILTRKYTWYPYIVVYLLLLCEIILDLKNVTALWLLVSAIRSLFINIVVMLTGLWFSLTMNSNKWSILDFVSFKIFQIGISWSFWYMVWTLYRIPKTTAVQFDNSSQTLVGQLEALFFLSKKFNRQLTKKRRASFHGFGWHDQLSGVSSIHSTMIDNSLSDDLNELAHDSDYAFLNAVHRSRSLDSLVDKNMADWFAMEANAIDDNSDSSSFSFNLAARAAEFLQLTPEELSIANKLKTTETTNEKHTNVLPRLPPLPTVNSFTDSLNEPSEVELNTIDIMSASKEESSQITLMNQNKCPLTLDELYSIFYKQK